MRILATSPGWNERGPSTIQSLDPPISVPTNMGSSSSATPAIPIVNLYSPNVSMLGTATSVATMAATETNSHTT